MMLPFKSIVTTKDKNVFAIGNCKQTIKQININKNYYLVCGVG